MSKELPNPELLVVLENPHKVVPGEYLNIQELFDRYLDWAICNKELERWKTKQGCDKNLRGFFLCCADHLAARNEADTFELYSEYLVDESFVLGLYKMLEFLLRHKEIKLNLEKIAKVFDKTDRELIEEFSNAEKRLANKK